MTLFGEAVSLGTAFFLILALLLALSFECVNGFHDTANAVATVIYTKALPPTVAVVWSGIWNLIGVLVSSGAVAYGIVALLPVELVLNVGSSAGFAMVFALLISAIIWNAGTWYLGLPASSSHSLIGSIMGVGLANSLFSPGHVFGEGVNWSKVQDTFASLLISPLVGFICSAILLLVAKALIRIPSLYREPDKTKAPPWWIRIILWITCTGVSFAHGSNDGQKGMGLIMLIMVGILPGAFALNMAAPPEDLQKILTSAKAAAPILDRYAQGGAQMDDKAAGDELSAYIKVDGKFTDKEFPAVRSENDAVIEALDGKNIFADVPHDQRSALRSQLYLVNTAIAKLIKSGKVTDPGEKAILAKFSSQIKPITDYIPVWVKVAVACALGFGTMVGWKRIVVTVGEKIGKSHLTYAQGASAELVAMGTILAADNLGLPVSTTHVLSSGVAGTMAANGSGLQMQTLRNIALAWLLTLPACVLLGAGFFSGGLFLIFNILHWH
jgi:inorganic phosphate transporter, PiT family